MKISIMGLGYVGAVAAGCLAKEGHEVIGVDPERAKVDLINEGRSPIIEKDLGEIIAEQVKAGRLHAATVVEDAVRHTDIVFVCVGTPSQPNGGIDLRYIRKVCSEIGQALRPPTGATRGPRDALSVNSAARPAGRCWPLPDGSCKLLSCVRRAGAAGAPG